MSPPAGGVEQSGAKLLTKLRRIFLWCRLAVPVCHHAIRAQHHTIKMQRSVIIQRRTGRDRSVAGPVKMRQHGTLGRNLGTGFGTVQTGNRVRHGPSPIIICVADLDRQRALCRRRRHDRRIKRCVRHIKRQPPQACHGKDNGVVPTFGKRCQPCVDIAAQQLDPQVRAIMTKQRLTTHRGGADNGTLWKRVNRRERPDQRITTILARQNRGDGGAIGKNGLHILHRVNRHITATIKQLSLQLLDEQPLATGIGK